MKQKWLWIVSIVLLLAALVGYRMFSRTNADVVQATPDIVIAATDIIKAFETDSSRAAKQFENKIVQVYGTVMKIDSAGAVALGETGMLSVVVVGMEQRHMADMQKIKKGTEAMLQGIYSGYERSSSNVEDLLSGLGTTVQLRSGGLKEKN